VTRGILIIGVVNNKGGVGKSTLAAALAVRATSNFNKVAIIDMDPSEGSGRWHANRKHNSLPENPMVYAGEADVDAAIEVMEWAGADAIVFDGAPNATERTQELVERCECVVIPMRPGDQDVVQTLAAMEVCKLARRPFIVVVNGAEAARTIKGELRENKYVLAAKAAIEKFAPEKVVWGPVIRRRDQFIDAMAIGVGVHEMRGKHAAAAASEIDALYEQIGEVVVAGRRA